MVISSLLLQNSDCEGYCRVNVGCVAWTLATKTNVDIPGQCVLYSEVGAQVPYPNCISGKVTRKYRKDFLHFPHFRQIIVPGTAQTLRESLHALQILTTQGALSMG